jgi:hypothetical protein
MMSTTFNWLRVGPSNGIKEMNQSLPYKKEYYFVAKPLSDSREIRAPGF